MKYSNGMLVIGWDDDRNNSRQEKLAKSRPPRRSHLYLFVRSFEAECYKKRFGL